MSSSPANVEKDSRRTGRVSLTLPVRVEAHVNQTISWNEITRLNDVSTFGAGFSLKRPVKRKSSAEGIAAAHAFPASDQHYRRNSGR